MTRLRAFSAIVIGALGVAVAYAAFRDYLPPETPQTRARRITGLSLSRHAVVEVADEEQAPFGGDDHVRFRFKIEATDFARLSREASREGYRALPADPQEGVFGPGPYTDPSARGSYRTERSADMRRLLVVILDARTHTLSVERYID